MRIVPECASYSKRMYLVNVFSPKLCKFLTRSNNEHAGRPTQPRRPGAPLHSQIMPCRPAPARALPPPAETPRPRPPRR